MNSSRLNDSGDGLGPATAKRTVQAAVATANNGDTIHVAAGTYLGSINVTKSLKLIGAQAGVDARPRNVVQAQESVLQGGGSNSATIILGADGITLDGFTVLGDPTGILTDIIGVQMYASISGTQMRNNIVIQNTIGAYPASNGSAQTVIEFNQFANNNLAGSASGNGIYTDAGLRNARISGNTFTGNSNCGLLITGALPGNANSGILVQNNDISICGVGVLMAFTSASTVDGNRISGSLQGVQMRGANDNISIINNTVTDSGQWPIVCFTRSDIGIDSRDLNIVGNTINQNVAVYKALPIGFVSRAAIDLRNVQGQVTIGQNAVNLNGVLPTTVTRVPGVEVQGTTTGYVNIVLNELRGGQIDSLGSVTPSAGVRVDSDLPNGSSVDVKFNKISGFAYGVDTLIDNTANSIHVNFNDLAGTFAIINEGIEPLDGLYNWFGQASGPKTPANPGGTGEPISSNVLFNPWLTNGTDLKPLDTSTQAAFLATVGFQTLNQFVLDAGSAVSLVSSNTSSVFGESITFSATVSAVSPGAGTPTGVVLFFDGSTAIGASMISTASGVTMGTLTLGTMSPGSHSVWAFYAGDDIFKTSSSAPITQNVAKAVVSIVATSATATESGSVKGLFTISSNLSVPIDTVINLSVAGTAVSGTDYTVIPPAATIPAGQSSVTLQVSGLANGIFKGDTTVIATLIAAPGYVLGATSSATVTVLEGDIFSFLSAPVANPNPAVTGQAVTFTASTNSPTAAYAWDFGDGTTSNSGSIVIHTYTIATTATVKLTCTTPGGLQLTAQVTVTVLTVSGSSNPNEIDSDGDGVSDALENALGTNPNDPNSSPVTNGKAPGALNIRNMSTALNFRRSGKDTITLTGYLPMAAPVALSCQKLVFDVGGVIMSFTLTAQGRGVIGMSRVTVATRPKNGLSTFTLKSGPGAYQRALSYFNFTNAAVTNVQAPVLVQAIFNQTLLKKSQPQIYSAKQGVSGKSK